MKQIRLAYGKQHIVSNSMYISFHLICLLVQLNTQTAAPLYPERILSSAGERG
jgi:hypothetical protein